jgi:hypothetical protein
MHNSFLYLTYALIFLILGGGAGSGSFLFTKFDLDENPLSESGEVRSKIQASKDAKQNSMYYFRLYE